MLLHLIRFVVGFLLIGLVVFIHELGHFAAARLLHVDVEVLSYGMGPGLFSFQGKNTEFRISALPFGGYCRMKGSIDLTKALRDGRHSLEVSEAGSYFATSPFHRFFIYASGPFTNFVLAFILLTTASLLPVERISNEAFIAPTYLYPTVFPDVDVRQEAVVPGDKVLMVDGVDVEDYQHFTSLLGNSPEGADVVLLRDGERIETHLFPVDSVYGLTLYQKPVIANPSDPLLEDGDLIVAVDGIPVESTLDVYCIEGDSLILTISRNGELFSYRTDERTFSFAWKSGLSSSSDATGIGALSYGLESTWSYFVSTLRTLGALICFDVDDARMVITGPVKAAQNIGNISMLAFSYSTNDGIRTLFHLLAIVSISLCIGNILPIPTFDGGQMLINAAEMVRGGNLKPRTYVVLQISGMLAAITIMVMMYALDIRAFFFKS